MAEFGENIRKAREEKGITQQTLADKLFVSRQAVSRWENGSRYPDLLTAKSLAAALDTALDKLLDNDDMQNYPDVNPVIEYPYHIHCGDIIPQETACNSDDTITR